MCWPGSRAWSQCSSLYSDQRWLEPAYLSVRTISLTSWRMILLSETNKRLYKSRKLANTFSFENINKQPNFNFSQNKIMTLEPMKTIVSQKDVQLIISCIFVIHDVIGQSISTFAICQQCSGLSYSFTILASGPRGEPFMVIIASVMGSGTRLVYCSHSDSWPCPHMSSYHPSLNNFL